MTNLDELYSTDQAFRDIVNEAAAAAIGTTSVEFAREWLMMDAPGEQAGDEPREDMRAEVAHLEARVELDGVRYVPARRGDYDTEVMNA